MRSCKEWQVEPIRVDLRTIWPITPDQPERLEEAILKMAASQDILVIIAGSSQGRDDFTTYFVYNPNR